MNKKIILALFISFVLVSGASFYCFKDQLNYFSDAQISEPITYLRKEKLPPPVHIMTDRAERFSVSSGEDYPIFTKELIADPFEVKNGEEQYFSVWTKDPEGVEKVTAKITTDAGEKIIEFQLAEGTENEGRWQGSWITENISLNDSYPTEFRIVNKNNKDRKSTFVWYLQR